MTDRIEWLLAAIAEDERMARGAAERQWAGSASPWAVAGDRHIRYASGGSESVVAIRVEHPSGAWERIYVKGDDGTTAAHIACWDPARVLAECNAKRRIIAEHQPEPGWDMNRVERDIVCGTCAGTDYAGDREGEWPCPTLRALASAFEGRPGWDPQWAIDLQ